MDLVFNTPNDRSGPGYLKLGWQEVGRVPVRFRPTSFRALPRLAGARCQAERWSLPVEAGLPAAEALADPAVAPLLASQPAASGLRTHRTAHFLSWRYSFGPLNYRVVPRVSSLGEGLAIFRARRRGTGVEATIVDVLVPGADPTLRPSLVQRILAVPGLDYALDLGADGATRGFLPLLGQGPTLYARALAGSDIPALDAWRLSLGDVELF